MYNLCTRYSYIVATVGLSIIIVILMKMKWNNDGTKKYPTPSIIFNELWTHHRNCKENSDISCRRKEWCWHVQQSTCFINKTILFVWMTKSLSIRWAEFFVLARWHFPIFTILSNIVQKSVVELVVEVFWIFRSNSVQFGSGKYAKVFWGLIDLLFGSYSVS